jgi:hypothetical protein
MIARVEASNVGTGTTSLVRPKLRRRDRCGRSNARRPWRSEQRLCYQTEPFAGAADDYPDAAHRSPALVVAIAAAPSLVRCRAARLWADVVLE